MVVLILPTTLVLPFVLCASEELKIYLGQIAAVAVVDNLVDMLLPMLDLHMAAGQLVLAGCNSRVKRETWVFMLKPNLKTLKTSNANKKTTYLGCAYCPY